MPAAVAVPAIAAVVGAVGSAAIAAHGNSSAAKTQQKSASDALQFQREQEAERRHEWEYRQAQAKAAWEARQKMLAPFLAGGASVLAKYGIRAPQESTPPPSFSAPMPSGYTGGPIPTTPSAPGPASMPPPPGVGTSSAGMGPAGLPTGTLGSMMAPQPAPFDWNAWRGLPNA